MLLKLLPKFWGVALLCLILTLGQNISFAEGTKQLDPNAGDYTKLMTNNAFYGSFAEYDGAVNSRLFVHIADPNNELVYLGLSRGTFETFDPSGIYLGDVHIKDYYFRILSPSGTVVYGPVLIDGTTANVSSRADAIAGPFPIVGAGGYIPFTFDPSGLVAGDYYIEFSDNIASASTEIIDIPYFDITVANNSGATPVATDGRLWSYNWAFKTTPTLNASSSPYGNFDRPFNGVVYAYTDDGFVNKIDFANSGFRGWFFTLAFNALGTGTSGVVSEDRKSVEATYSVSPQYKIFLLDPDNTEYPSGTLGGITTDPQINICDPGEACVWIETTMEGQVEVLLDFDSGSGAGKYDLNTADVLLLECITALPGETAPYRRCIEWDGLNGLGAGVNMGSSMSAYAKLQQGVTHYASYDVEFVVNGYSIDIIRPTGGVFVDKLYYDDSGISVVPGNGADKIELDGCTSPCHAWENFNYGNENTINTWWISNTSTRQNLHIPWCVPTANEDTAYTAVNIALNIDVIANDQGTGLWPGSVNITSPPVNGNIVVNTVSGIITYTPDSGFTGEDGFWYEVCNADTPPICDDTWVVIYVNSVTAINDDNNTLINQGLSGNVLTNDVDNEGDDIFLNLTPYSNPSHGGVVFMADGSYTYTPATDFVGQDQFEYIICDNGIPSACDTAMVIITVTDDPSFSNNEVIANADEGITNIDVPLTANVLANDADVDGDNLTVNTTPTSNPTNGILVLMANGDFTYTPNPGFVGQDQFSYEVCDDGIPQACAGAIVVIDVIPDLNGAAPNAPFAGDDFNVTNIDTGVSGDLSTNDSGGGSINTTPIGNPTHGSVTINSNGTYTYTPTAGYTGPDQFVYETCSTGGGGSTSNTTISTNVPIGIIDGAMVSSITTINSGGTILDVNLSNLKITHTFINDLTITLVSPAGTSVTLITGQCGDSDNFDVIFDDEGATLSLCSDLVSGLPFKPINGVLSSFDGENSTGVWTLEVIDGFAGDNGSIDSWSLEIETQNIVCAQATAYILVVPPPVTDLDEDNDGIPDVREVYTGDHDSDGTPDYADPDFCIAIFQGLNGWNCSNGLPDPDFDLDGDGIPNIVDADYPYTIPDSDGDGVYDYLDLDSDNDGLPDIIEAGGTDTDGNGLADDVTDSDDDGLVDVYDPVNSLNSGVNEGTALVEIDTDGDGQPDYLDLDTDNDGIPDLVELGGTDTNGDGQVDDLTDSDTDGLVDTYDPSNESNAGNNEGTPHFVTGVDSGDGTPVSFCTGSCSIDGDDLLPHIDLDSDNDGLPDIIEAGGVDINGDGIVDNLMDSDNDGLVDTYDESNNVNMGVNEGTAIPMTNTDLDAIPDYLDLDSDNDGIPDLIESGGVDTNGNGIVDDLTDSDGDGLVDTYDPDNEINPGNNEGIPHFITGADSGNGQPTNACTDCDHDADNLPPYIDLDADNDGILDIIEAGGMDSNNDGMIADAVGTNGYSNGLDPADGGVPYFTTSTDDSMDANTRPEYSAAAGTGDSDGDDVPDYLDVDSDNDGIYDNYEAQPTTTYVAPVGMDSDSDGIDNAYDADALAATNGLNPYNHDSTDQPDYLDLDADNDNIPDWQEAWDNLFDGDSQADNIAGHTGIDSDGDGLLDVYDTADSDPANIIWEGNPADDINGNNGAAAGTVFSDNLLTLLPENGGNDNNEPDYRDQLIDCGTPLVYYALSEMGGSSTAYSFDAALGRHIAGTAAGATRATTFCEKGGWYYYYNPLEPTNYLFGIRYNASNPGTIPIEDLIDYIEIRLDTDLLERTVDDGSNAQLVMARDWHVVFKKTSEPGATYDIKYYFDPNEFVALMDAVEGMDGYINPELKWFKADQGNGVSFDLSDITADGIANMVDITAYATSSIDMNTGEASNDASTAGNGKNYISFEGLPGFSGGTALISMSAVLPVELNSFSTKENGCEVAINWITEAEENFSHFVLERSDGKGQNFLPIKSINSGGDANGNAYFWKDSPSKGIFYYRLKMVDWDGSFAYSEVESASIDCGDLKSVVAIYPNPIQGKEAVLYIVCESPKDDPVFQIVDLFGRTVLTKKVIREKGWVKTSINVGDLSSGSYYLISRDIGMEYGKKFLKIE